MDLLLAHEPIPGARTYSWHMDSRIRHSHFLGNSPFSIPLQRWGNVPQKDRSPCVSQKVETILCVNLRLKFCASVWGWRLCDETVFQTPDRDKEEVNFLLETLETCNVKVILVIVQCNTPSPISTSPILGVATGGEGGAAMPEVLSNNRPTGYNGFGLKG